MLNFPSYSFVLVTGLIAAFIGLFLTSFTTYWWIKENNSSATERFQLLMGTFGGLVFLLVGIFFSYSNFIRTYEFRNISISNVVGFQVFKSEDEYKIKV